MALTRRVDLKRALSRIEVPTLVLHRRDDPYVPFAASREAAALIPNARLLPLEGESHLPFFGDAIAVTDAVLGFLRDVSMPSSAIDERLTSREREVLALLASGCANREIAERLVVSVRTVERHLLNIYGKLNARGRADAIVSAIRHGLG